MSWLGNLFGGNQKKDTSYGGPRPYGTLRDAEGGQQYLDTIRQRLAGQGVGYGEGYAEKNSSPIVANMRNQFNSYQMPDLKSELSVSGRRKGSAGFDQIARAYNQQGLNEGDVFARLQQQNDVASHNDVNQAYSDLGAYAQNDMNARNNLANFEYTNNRNQVSDATNQRAEGNAAFQRLLGTAALGIQGVGGMGGIGGGGTGQAMVSQNYAPTAMQSFGGDYLSPFKKYGQQGGVSNPGLRLKY